MATGLLVVWCQPQPYEYNYRQRLCKLRFVLQADRDISMGEIRLSKSESVRSYQIA